MAAGRRVLIVDPTCVVPTGHNARLCRIFARAFEKRGFEARYLIPSHGKASFPEEEAFVIRALPYPYWRYYGRFLPSPDHRLDARLNALVDGALDERGIGPLKTWRRFRADADILKVAGTDIERCFDEVGLGPGDVLISPTADYYTSEVLLRWMRRQPPDRRPTVILRFLCMLEISALYRPDRRLKRLLRRVAALCREHYRIVLATETETWAAKLERRAEGRLPVLVVPVPPQPAAPPEAPRDCARLGLSLISLRRPEQGITRLPQILSQIDPDLSGRLDSVAQEFFGPKETQLKAQVLHDTLSRLHVRFLPGWLGDRELASALANLDVTLLPYQPENYASRGSSMLFEAADQGHTVLASADCGFSSEIEDFGLGRLCRSDADFTESLNALLRQVAEGLHPRAASEAATARYNAHRQALVDRLLDLATA